jgi:hypothetical protein
VLECFLGSCDGDGTEVGAGPGGGVVDVEVARKVGSDEGDGVVVAGELEGAG